MLPIRANSKLPPGYASSAINTKLVSGDIEGYLDLGNGFQLAKAAPIFTLEQADNDDWLQFTNSELASFALDIRAVPGIIANDPTGRRYITGYNALTGGAYPNAGVFQGASPFSVPQFTNTFYATDASQQGSSALGAFPYKTFPLGIADPLSDPTASAPTAAGTTTNYEYGQEASINSATVAAAGTGYTVGDVLTLSGGTLVAGLPRAQLTVTSVDPSTGGVTGVSLLGGGFYTAGNAPTSPAAVTGGTGSGATFTVTPEAQNTNGWGYVHYSSGSSLFNFGVSGNKWVMTMQQGAAGNGWSTNYSNQAFGLATASAFTMQVDAAGQDNGAGQYPDLTFSFAGLFNGAYSVVGPGATISFNDGALTLYSNITVGTSGGAVSGTVVGAPASYAFVGGTQYRVTVSATANTAGTQPGFSVKVSVATVAAPNVVLASVQGFVPFSGDQFGIGINNRVLPSSNGQDANFENVLITVTQPASAVTVESTNYVYTYDQQIPGDVLTQESGPSNPSATVDVFIDSTTNPPTRTGVTITIPPCPSGEFIAYYNLYRLVLDTSGNETYTFVTQFAAWNLTSVTGSFTVGETVTGGTSGATGKVLSYGTGVLVVSGVAGLFQVGETITGGSSSAHGVYASSALSSVTITYVDSAQDSAIGPDVLISQTWAPPPANMQGMVAVANSTMCGFFDNVLCFSAPGYPHAWPVENQYAIDTLIQGTVVVDTTVLILSQAYPYTAWGTDPTSYSMSKEVSIQGCTASRSTATHKEYGAIFASGNGLCYYKGQGQLGLIRIGPYGQPPFSYEQFQALTPSSIRGELHDDYYFFFWNNGSSKGGYVLDLTPTGFGVIALDIHATEAFVDKEVDVLWMVPDQSTYPIPVGGSPVGSAQNIAYQWEYAATQRPRVWARNDNLFGGTFSPAKARIQSQFNAGTDTITLTLSSEQGTAYNTTVAQQRSFTIAAEPGFSWNVSMTVTGTARIKTFALVESAEELNDNG